MSKISSNSRKPYSQDWPSPREGSHCSGRRRLSAPSRPGARAPLRRQGAWTTRASDGSPALRARKAPASARTTGRNSERHSPDHRARGPREQAWSRRRMLPHLRSSEPASASRRARARLTTALSPVSPEAVRASGGAPHAQLAARPPPSKWDQVTPHAPSAPPPRDVVKELQRLHCLQSGAAACRKGAVPSAWP